MTHKIRGKYMNIFLFRKLINSNYLLKYNEFAMKTIFINSIFIFVLNINYVQAQKLKKIWETP